MTTRFDESIPAFIRALARALTPTAVSEGWLLRDVSGRLAFVSAKPLDAELVSAANSALESSVPEYVRGHSSVLHVGTPGVEPLIQAIEPLAEEVVLEKGQPALLVRVIDRRIVGQDWLTRPAPGWQPPAPARLIFASMKGGVGRSTALAVLAAELARQGGKVLVVDLDLEAPGIGTMLIGPDEQPAYGVLDWYVEYGIRGSADAELTSDIVAPSPFGAGKGLIDVAPAVGKSTDTHPQNFLSKLARAYLEAPADEGRATSFLGLTRQLIDLLSSQKSYSAILVDARAGLNESTAAALLGLGGDLLLFGVDTPQTFSSYAYLFSHFSRLTAGLTEDEREAWLYRLRMVHAKAPADGERQSAFRDKAYELFSKHLYRSQPLLSEDSKPIEDGKTNKVLMTEQFGLDDQEGPHYAWPILSDANYAEFDPLSSPAQITSELSARTYAGLLDGVATLIADPGSSQ